jgi:hypothetical protein
MTLHHFWVSILPVPMSPRIPEPPSVKCGDILNRDCKYLNPEWLNPDVLTSVKCAVNPESRCQDCGEVDTLTESPHIP